MLVVVQRVSRAEVRVPDQNYRAAIETGLLILLGVEAGDEQSSADWLANRCANLRIFPDDEGKMNRSVSDVHGSAMVVSQFTLAGDCRKGHRPSFIHAAPPEAAEPMYEYFASQLRDTHGIETRTGIFQAQMEIELINDGPVTLIIRHPN